MPNATLKDCKVYLLNVKEQEELNKFLEELLKSGQIWPSKLPYAAPFFFIKKRMDLYDQYCHDLVKWLSDYLYFFSFLFLLDLQLQDGVWESITWLCHNVTMVKSQSQSITWLE